MAQLFIGLDANLMQKPEINKLMIRYGDEGLSIYIQLLLQLASAKDYMLSLAELETAAYQMRKQNVVMIEDVIKTFGLFFYDKEYFWCEQLKNRMEKLDHKINMASKAGKKSAKVKKMSNLSASSESEKSTNVEQTLQQPLNERLTDVATIEYNISKLNINKDNKTKVKANIYDDVFFENKEFVEAWKEFIDFRRKIKSPLTDGAIKRSLSTLHKVAEENIDVAIQIIHRTIERGWKGFFPLNQITTIVTANKGTTDPLTGNLIDLDEPDYFQLANKNQTIFS
jgi:hypothetical protein